MNNYEQDITSAEKIAFKILRYYLTKYGLEMCEEEVRHIRDAIFAAVKSALCRKRLFADKVGA